MTEFIASLESYLLDTGQIHALAQRQARMLSGPLHDVQLRTQAHLLLLFNCAALYQGAPRAQKEFLLQPLNAGLLEQHVAAYKAEHHGLDPAWARLCGDQEAYRKIDEILTAAFLEPRRFAPLTGAEPDQAAAPETGDDPHYPLLVISRQKKQMGFSRYWRAVTELEKNLRTRLSLQPGSAIPEHEAAAALAAVFNACPLLAPNQKFHYRQVAAAALALRSPFLIISGSPGTGKTRVVVQILRVLIRAQKNLFPERMVLCAPTGRAKARLGESIDSDLERLDDSSLDKVLKNLKRQTLHGLLGMRPDGSFKYNPANPLPHQVIVVDEASMVDLTLFAGLMQAAAPDCRIILAGDMHQLPSVEAGAVLGDLTGAFTEMDDHPTLTPACAAWVQTVIRDVAFETGPGRSAASLTLPTPELLEKAGLLADHALVLTHSYRSTKEILAASAQVNLGNTGQVRTLFAPPTATGMITLDTRPGITAIKEWLQEYYAPTALEAVTAMRGLDLGAAHTPGHSGYAAARSILDAVFKILDESRMLTLAHAGPRGRVVINALADKFLRPQLDKGSTARFFHGQQVMLQTNLHDLDLYNGDTGLVVQTGRAGFKVVFRRGARYAIHALERLKGLEPAFAMTVHKAQGSEFNAVLLVLPEYKSPLLTRQIIYTGITRARKRVRVLGSGELLEHAIATRQTRPGGLELN